MNEERPAHEPANSPDTADPALETLRREADESRDRYLRAVAELDNLRKRAAREVDQARRFGAERLAQGVLPVRDSLEAGVAAAEKAGQDALAEGQRATLRLLDDAFAAVGIREIDPRGEPFDPNKHEALSLMQAPNVEPNTILEVIQKGYELNDRLLRAARVIVARGQDA
jgi:molecular chaperone GrpE